MKTLIGLIILIANVSLAAETGGKCASLFMIDGTIKNLAELKITIDQAKANGTSSIEITALTENFKKKSTEFYKYVRKNNLMTKDQYINNLKKTIVDLQVEKEITDQHDSEKRIEEKNIQQSQDKEFKDTAIDGIRLVMNRVDPGPFKMGDAGEVIEKYVSEPFEMAATQTTQVVWKKVVELAHAKLGDEYKDLNIDPSYFKGDTRPVDSVSYFAVELWIKALNELSQRGDSAIEAIIPKHIAGDKYRLPTEEEWEFVARGRGQHNEVYYFGNDASELEKHAWFNRNSKKETHYVALLEPLKIDGKEFYDMYGNIWQWTSSLYNKGHPEFTVRGGGFFSDAIEISSGDRRAVGPISGTEGLGFRLVRDLGAKP